MENETIISLKNVSAAYDNRRVLQNIDLEIKKYDYLGIIGPNGGGKTTLVKLILGLIAPETGSIHFFKEGTEQKNIRIGYLPQYNSFDKNFPISVHDVVLSGLHSRKSIFQRFTKNHHSLVKETLNQLELTEYADRPIGNLSGGQRQRVFLGRALVSSPDVLILDEPSTYIDKHSEQKLYKILEEVNKECAILLVSHDLGTVISNVKNIACVNTKLHYHPGVEESEKWIEQKLACPFELLAHGHIPHRVLAEHEQ